jgi:hypothetical protein
VPYLYFLPDSAIPLFPPICFHISPLFVPWIKFASCCWARCFGIGFRCAPLNESFQYAPDSKGPIDKPFPIKGPHADRRGEFRSFNNNDLNLLEFKQPGLQIPQHHNFNKNNIGSNGPAAFSLKDKHKTLEAWRFTRIFW